MIKPGDWVVWIKDRHYFGIVRDVFMDSNGEWRINLYCYDFYGICFGRFTDAGPGDCIAYEPGLAMSGFERIQEPKFPIPDENWETYLIPPPMFP